MTINTPPARRHWITAIFLQLGIRLRFWIESFLGFKVLLGLAGYPSPWRPKNCPKYDLITRVGFVWVWLTAGLAREIPAIYYILAKIGFIGILNRVHEWLSNRLMNLLTKDGYTAGQRTLAIPEYDWKNGTPEEFYELFVKRPHPVILRGFMKDADLLTKLNWDTVMKRFSEEEVFLTKKELDGYPGKLKEVDNPKVYLHNSEILFSKYPEIRNLFQYERLEPYLKMKVGYEQIFVGREGTGSPFHHAPVHNMFYMIDGVKEWWFIDPYDTFLAYPMIVLGRAAAALLCAYPHDYNKAAFPLFQFCPVYTAKVYPGDVMYNSPWWWHGIKNVTPTTVAVASRWHPNGIAGGNFLMTEENNDVYRLGSLNFFIGLQSWSFLHSILQTPSPRFDEHATLRERKNRYVHNQTRFAELGGIDACGVLTKF